MLSNIVPITSEATSPARRAITAPAPTAQPAEPAEVAAGTADLGLPEVTVELPAPPTDVETSIHEGTGRTVYDVIGHRSGDVLSEIPLRALLDFVASLQAEP